MTRSGSSRIAALVAIPVVSCLAACGGVSPAVSAGASQTQTATATASPLDTPSPSTAPSPTPTIPPGWSPYTSATQRVSFDLPPGWKVYCDGVASWLLVDPRGLYTTCPQGDGQVGIFVESVVGTGPPAGMSTISTNRSLYSTVQTTTVTVNGVSGTRLSGDQTAGQGSGSSQVEYDFAPGGRTYYVLAVVRVAGIPTATAAQVDQFVQTFTFGG